MIDFFAVLITIVLVSLCVRLGFYLADYIILKKDNGGDDDVM